MLVAGLVSLVWQPKMWFVNCSPLHLFQLNHLCVLDYAVYFLIVRLLSDISPFVYNQTFW